MELSIRKCTPPMLCLEMETKRFVGAKINISRWTFTNLISTNVSFTGKYWIDFSRVCGLLGNI